MNVNSGKHDHRQLQTGEIIYLTQPPGGKWGIDSYEWSWPEGEHLTPDGTPLGPKELKTARVFAQDVGWENHEFESPDQAYAFVERQIQAGKVPGTKKHSS